LQFSSQAALLVDWASRFHATRQGMFADAEFHFDGSKLTVCGKNLRGNLQQDLAGNIDQAIAAIESVIGLSMSGADLPFADPCAVLSGDWQIWIKDGDEPLPMKYVITSKRVATAPQLSLMLSDWNTRPTIRCLVALTWCSTSSEVASNRESLGQDGQHFRTGCWQTWPSILPPRIFTLTSCAGKTRGLAGANLPTPVLTGAGEKSRTPDLRITNALLYQLSYTGESVGF
jgi:hypothetical protein